MWFSRKKRKDEQHYAGFVTAPASAPEKKAQALENVPPPPVDKEAAHEMSFLEILAAFYGVNADYFNNGWKPVLERFTLSPDTEQWSRKNDALPLTVQLMAGTQEIISVQRDSVTVPGLPLDKDHEEAMKAAIEMAILARANPAMAHGVELMGTAEEKAILAAAAAIVGLQIKNPPVLDDVLKALAEKMAAQINAVITADSDVQKPDTNSKSAIENDLPAAEKSRGNVGKNFDSLDENLKSRITRIFNDQNSLNGLPAPPIDEIKRNWDNAPEAAREEFINSLDSREASMKKAFEQRAQAEKAEQEKREELARALSTARNVLTDPLPAAIVDTLRDGDVKTDLYQKVKADLLKEPEPEDKRKSRVSSASVKKILDEKYKIPGDMRGKTKTILTALEQEGIIRMAGSNRRVVLAQPNGMLTPPGYDPQSKTATAVAAPALRNS